jgi:hypothetical protein
MTTSGFDPDLVPVDVRVDDAMIRVRFQSGLELATPLARFPRLQNATPEQRNVWRLIGRGDGIHWPEADEDISVRGLFSGLRPLPSSAIEEVPVLIGELFKVTRRLNSIFEGRPFTPDGHLVGSIGEVVAEYIYGVRLEPCSTAFVDARTRDQRTVQIKLTGENGRSYGVRWSGRPELVPPDFLICLKLNSDGFTEIYNDVFPVDLLADRKIPSNGQLALSVKSLLSRNRSVLPKVNSFDSINRWFAPRFQDVA